VSQRALDGKMTFMAAALRDRFRRSAGGDADVIDEDSDGDKDDAADEDEAGEWLAYELHEWSLESRVMLQQLLVVDKVVHSWQGTTLMVHESLETAVDNLVDEVQETEKAKEATHQPIGPEDELTAFDLSEWPEELRSELVDLLVQSRVSHIFDTEGDTEATHSSLEAAQEPIEDAEEPFETVEDHITDPGEFENDPDDAGDTVCDLLVREADEERVELLIDDLLAREEEAQFEELEGLEVNELLSTLFVACDRLRRDPADVDGLQSVRAAAQRIAGVRTPFGFSSSNWKNLRNSVAELLVLVEDVSGLRSTAVQEAPEDDADSQTSNDPQSTADTEDVQSGSEDAESGSEALREAARSMAETLRTLV